MGRNAGFALDAVLEADPLAALRSATASRHTLLDSGLPIGADYASLHDYTAHLTMLRAWLAPLGDWLAGFAHVDDGPEDDVRLDMLARNQARLDRIDADLIDAGIGPSASAPAAVQAWPDAASAAYRWGACYVVEGSQLGGAVLYQRLSARLAPHPLRYLQGDPAGPGPRWRVFTQALRAQLRTPAEIAEACTGACEAFDRILLLAGHETHSTAVLA